MRKITVLLLLALLTNPTAAFGSTAKVEVEQAIKRTSDYLYSKKLSITVKSTMTFPDNSKTSSEYVRDKNRTEYLYNQGNKHRFIKDTKNTYLHSSYLTQYHPFDKIINGTENAMYLVPNRFENFYIYGKNPKSAVDDPNGYLNYLTINNKISPQSEYTSISPNKYKIKDNESNQEIYLTINDKGLVSEITTNSLDRTIYNAYETYNYDEISNILSVLPKYDYRNLDTIIKTNRYNELYYAEIINENLNFIYTMAGISAKRNNATTGDLSVKDITANDLRDFFKKIKYWFDTSNSISTYKGYSLRGDKLQQALKGYNNKTYYGCLGKAGNALAFKFARC